MPGLHVTDRQVRRFMTSRREGHTQAVAAAQAGFSERTGRRWSLQLVDGSLVPVSETSIALCRARGWLERGGLA